MHTMIQSSAEFDHIARLIEHIPIAMLTIQEPSGVLSSRPMAVLEMDADGALWFYTDTATTKLEQLKTINVCFADRARGTYVSLSGHGEIVNDRLRLVRLWTAFARPWFPEGPDSPTLGMLKIVPTTADYWDAADSKMDRTLGTAESFMAHKPVAMAERGSPPAAARCAAIAGR